MSENIDLDSCYQAVTELLKQAEEVCLIKDYVLLYLDGFPKKSCKLQLIRNGISSAKSVQHKSCEVDLVTETDQQVEKLLISGLHEKFPDHKYEFKFPKICSDYN